MKTRIKVLLGGFAVLVAVFFIWFFAFDGWKKFFPPKIANDTITTALADAEEPATPTSIPPTAKPTEATGEAPTATPKVVTPTPAPEEVEKPMVVEYEAPANYFPLPDEDGNLLGISYSLNTPGPHIVKYPYQSTLIWASGKFILAGDLATLFVGEFSFSFAEDIGDIVFDVCENKNGCTAGSIGMKAGHAAVTVVFSGYEDPKDSLAWAINNMFDPVSGNCGSGCNSVFVGNMADGEVYEYSSAVWATDLTYAQMPTPPYTKVSITGESTPGGAKVLVSNDTPIGHLYYLADKTAYVSVNEAGGTVIYCGAPCKTGDDKYSAGTAVSFTGVPTDGSTPKDLNYTVKVESSDPAMIRVILVYSGSYESEVSRLKEEYPDWIWVE